MGNIVEVEGITKTFRHGKEEFYALRDVSFDIKEGEIFGLLGPNGAGKSTLINILTTVLSPDEGTAKILGYDAFKNPYEVLGRINSISGDTRFHWLLKTRDILKFYSQIYGLKPQERNERIELLAAKLEIRDLMGRRYQTLSTGQKMRVNLVKSLLNTPRFVLYDEPTIGLDPDIAVKTRGLIKEINKSEGTTILLTSHYMSEMENLCRRVAFIDRGVVSDIGSIKMLKARKFSTYTVRIGLAKVRDRKLLEDYGFRVSKNMLTKEIDNRSDPSDLIRFLVENHLDVISFETKRPDLEDYFIKMTRDRG
jgi:ABC-2 type transport system ATP-binding protein